MQDFRKVAVLSLLSFTLCAVGMPHSTRALTLGDGPDVEISDEFEGIWVGQIPSSCGGKKKKKGMKAKKSRRSVLKLCVDDTADGANRALSGSVINKRNLKVMQDDGQHRPVGFRLSISDSIALSNTGPAEQAMVLVDGQGDREGLLTLIMAAEGFEHGDANPGDIVGTFGNCNGIIWRYKKANPDCD